VLVVLTISAKQKENFQNDFCIILIEELEEKKDVSKFLTKANAYEHWNKCCQGNSENAMILLVQDGIEVLDGALLKEAEMIYDEKPNKLLLNY